MLHTRLFDQHNTTNPNIKFIAYHSAADINSLCKSRGCSDCQCCSMVCESRAQLKQCWYLESHCRAHQCWASSTLGEQGQAKGLVWVPNGSYNSKDQGVPPCFPWDGLPVANMHSYKRWLWSFLSDQGCSKPWVLHSEIDTPAFSPQLCAHQSYWGQYFFCNYRFWKEYNCGNPAALLKIIISICQCPISLQIN